LPLIDYLKLSENYVIIWYNVKKGVKKDGRKMKFVFRNFKFLKKRKCRRILTRLVMLTVCGGILLSLIMQSVVKANDNSITAKGAVSKEEAVNTDEVENDKEADSSEINTSEKLAEGKKLDVNLITQLPELYNGCEITSLTMLLNYKEIEVSKLELAEKVPVDYTALVRNEDESFIWGNPEYGFVGDVYGDDMGFAIDPEPLIPLIEEYYPGQAIDLTGDDIEAIKASIMNENPVIAWVTADFTRPYEFRTWTDSNGNQVRGTFETHAVLLTGYDEEYFYYNDPLSGYKNAYISIDVFEAVWSDMGRKALTVG